jgi:hypothetical protein
MAWPSSGDVDTTKFDNDADKISLSRPELYKMAGYVNDMIDAGGAGNTFTTVNADGTNLVADSTTDTLNVVGGTNITITGDAGTDTLTISATGAAAPTTTIYNGTSNVSIPTADGNVVFVSDGNEKMRVNDNATAWGVIGIEMYNALSVPKILGNSLILQQDSANSGTDIVAQFTGDVEFTGGNITYSGVDGEALTATYVEVDTSFKPPINSRNITANITGELGEIRCLSDQGGKMCYWDTTNSRWSYIHDNSAI